MNILQNIESDYRAEVLAMQMLIQDGDFSKVIIDRLGNIARTHTRDVYSVYDEISTVNLDKYTVLQSYRQSIYESMPESVFHPPTLGGLGKSTEQILEQIKEQRKREEDARVFFKPFEQEAPYLEMYALLMEMMFEKKGTYNNLYRLFEKAWPIIKNFPKSITLSFIYILPVLSEVRGKKDRIIQCLSFLLGYTVHIKEYYTSSAIDKKKVHFIMGHTQLGLNSTLGGVQNDGFLTWKFYIGPVPLQDAEKVLPESGFDKLLNTLLEYMVPAHINVEKKITIDCKQSSTLTADPTSARLGHTLTL